MDDESGESMEPMEKVPLIQLIQPSSTYYDVIRAERWPAPLRTRYANRLNPGNDIAVRDVPPAYRRRHIARRRLSRLRIRRRRVSRFARVPRRE